MTIVLSTQYPGKADAPSAGYPQGSFKNVTAPGAGDGTPWEKVWVNDWAGFFQRLVSEAGITPSGSPDTILAGDNWDALQSLFQRGIPHIDSGTANAHVLASALGGDISAYYDGFTAQYAVNILNTGAVTANVNAIGAKAVELPGGVALTGGELNADQNITIRYNSSDDKFYIISGIPNLSLDMIDGLEISNNTIDPNKDIDFAAGAGVDSSRNTILKLTTALVKQLDASWAVGTNAGGLFSGSIAANTTYHCFIIQKDTDNSIDCGFDISPTAANIPSGYTKFRIIGSIITDSSSNILGITQNGDDFILDVNIQDYSSGNMGTSAFSIPLTVPDGIIVKAIVYSAFIWGSATGNVYGLLTSLNQTDSIPSATNYNFFVNAAAAGISSVDQREYETDTNTQIRARFTVSGADLILSITTRGWRHPRGKY